MLMTLYAVGGGARRAALGGRFAAEGRRFDLLLCGGFFTSSLSWAAFAIGPAVGGAPRHRDETWAGLAGVLARLARSSRARRSSAAGSSGGECALVERSSAAALSLALICGRLRALGVGLPDARRRRAAQQPTASPRARAAARS